MPKTQQTPASVLNSLMEEYQLNPFSVSKQIDLSHSLVRNIAMGKAGITVHTALRLSKFFGQNTTFWLDLQQQTDMQKAAEDKGLQNVLKKITKVKKPVAPAKTKSQGKGKKANALSGKQKNAAPQGAKPASRKPKKK